ncbi:MAG: hypothetical protein Q3985_01365 [Eubacteriales bacterium]|nr:hypothetical protein [Eubacteriales bacterium]
MSQMPEMLCKTTTETEDGYTVYRDYGKQGGGVDRVHVPPHDPDRAAKNRRQLNAVLARYGYKLQEKGEEGHGELLQAGH